MYVSREAFLHKRRVQYGEARRLVRQRKLCLNLHGLVLAARENTAQNDNGRA